MNMTYLSRSFNPFLHSFPSSRTKQPRCLFSGTQKKGSLSRLVRGERLCVKKHVSRFQNFSKLSDSSAVVVFSCIKLGECYCLKRETHWLTAISAGYTQLICKPFEKSLNILEDDLYSSSCLKINVHWRNTVTIFWIMYAMCKITFKLKKIWK